MTDKSSLRKWAKEQRKAIHRERLNQASFDFCDAVAKTEVYREAPVVLLYHALPGELDLSSLAARAWGDGKTVAYPRCTGEGKMIFFSIKDAGELVPGKYGIREPEEGLAPLSHIPADSLCLVPGLVFDRSGHRLGYGGGYYDRFLATHPCVTLGGCLTELYVDHVPTEPTDIPVDIVLRV